MNVLVFEDRGSVSHYLEEALRSQGHQVFSAFSVPDAQTYWEDEEIDCIVADLNMSPEGLKDDGQERTARGLLTGWVWLVEHVFKEKEQMKPRTIIYSDYLNVLKDNVQADALKGVHLVPKKGTTSPAKEMLSFVERIARMVEGKKQ